jgi:hypothetical protein
MKIVLRHGVLFITLVATVLVIGGPVLSHSAAFAQVDSAVNDVGAQFGTSWIYDSPDDVFTNDQVTGRKWWEATVHNGPDETRAPVSKLALTLESTLAFNSLQREHLETSGPPTYRWSFGDVPEETSAGTWVDSLHGSDSVLVTFIPGFDASRSADRTEFTEPATQTLTITLTPREATEGFSVFVQAEESDLVDPVITSPASGEGVSLPPDGHLLHINPTGLELNATWTVAVTIQVTPKASEVVFMPYVMISRESEAVAAGTETGSSLSHSLGDPSDEAGTWTWSAEGNYQWAWEERLSRNVSWLPTSEPDEGTGW